MPGAGFPRQEGSIAGTFFQQLQCQEKMEKQHCEDYALWSDELLREREEVLKLNNRSGGGHDVH